MALNTNEFDILRAILALEEETREKISRKEKEEYENSWDIDIVWRDLKMERSRLGSNGNEWKWESVNTYQQKCVGVIPSVGVRIGLGTMDERGSRNSILHLPKMGML